MDRQAAVASVRTWRGSQAEHPRPLTKVVLTAGPVSHKRDSTRRANWMNFSVVETPPIR